MSENGVALLGRAMVALMIDVRRKCRFSVKPRTKKILGSARVSGVEVGETSKKEVE